MPLFNAFPSDSDDASRASMCSLYYWSILNEVIDGACKTGTTALKLNTGFLILIILEITQVAFKIAYPANAKESSSTAGIHNFCLYPTA